MNTNMHKYCDSCNACDVLTYEIIEMMYVMNICHECIIRRIYNAIR